MQFPVFEIQLCSWCSNNFSLYFSKMLNLIILFISSCEAIVCGFDFNLRFFCNSCLRYDLRRNILTFNFFLEMLKVVNKFYSHKSTHNNVFESEWPENYFIPMNLTFLLFSLHESFFFSQNWKLTNFSQKVKFSLEGIWFETY